MPKTRTYTNRTQTPAEPPAAPGSRIESQTTFLVRLEGEGDLSVEIFGGSQKGDLFESAFQRKLILTVS